MTGETVEFTSSGPVVRRTNESATDSLMRIDERPTGLLGRIGQGLGMIRHKSDLVCGHTCLWQFIGQLH